VAAAERAKLKQLEKEKKQLLGRMSMLQQSQEEALRAKKAAEASGSKALSTTATGTGGEEGGVTGAQMQSQIEALQFVLSDVYLHLRVKTELPVVWTKRKPLLVYGTFVEVLFEKGSQPLDPVPPLPPPPTPPEPPSPAFHPSPAPPTHLESFSPAEPPPRRITQSVPAGGGRVSHFFNPTPTSSHLEHTASHTGSSEGETIWYPLRHAVAFDMPHPLKSSGTNASSAASPSPSSSSASAANPHGQTSGVGADTASHSFNMLLRLGDLALGDLAQTGSEGCRLQVRVGRFCCDSADEELNL
jgi:hypothetical protein